MKQYLWLGIAAIFVSAYASDNPFELKSNFGQLDQEQEVLLDDLKKISEAKELVEEVVVDEATQDAALAPEEEKPDSLSKVPENEASEVAPAKVSDTLTEAEKESEKRLNAMREAALAASREEAAKKEAAKQEAVQKAKLLEEAKKKEAELVAAKKEAAKKEVEAYEKQRAEKLAKQTRAEALEKEKLKIADERKNNKLPKELRFFQKLIEAKTTGKHKPLKGELKKTLETILKEKNNPNYTADDVKKEFDSLKKDKKDAGMMIVAYMMAKSVVLQESMNSDDMEKYVAKFQKNSFSKDKDNMEEMFKKYPNEVRALGFNLLEDILTNGIPQLNFNMKMNATFSSDPALVKEPTLEISASTKQDTVAGINIEKEKREAKVTADKAYEEAVKEMSQED